MLARLSARMGEGAVGTCNMAPKKQVKKPSQLTTALLYIFVPITIWFLAFVDGNSQVACEMVPDQIESLLRFGIEQYIACNIWFDSIRSSGTAPHSDRSRRNPRDIAYQVDPIGAVIRKRSPVVPSLPKIVQRLEWVMHYNPAARSSKRFVATCLP